MKRCRIIISMAILISILSSCHHKQQQDEDDLKNLAPVVVRSLPPAGTYWQSAGCTAIDSVDVTYMNYACDCPKWIRMDSLRESEKDTTKQFFNNVNNSYYIEPSGADDPIDTLRYSGMRVMLYGRIDTGLRYPKNDKFIDPDPPKGKVFIYCGYRVL